MGIVSRLSKVGGYVMYLDMTELWSIHHYDMTRNADNDACLKAP